MGLHETKLKYRFGSKVKYSQSLDIKSAVKMALKNQSNNISVLFLLHVQVFQIMKIIKLEENILKI